VKAVCLKRGITLITLDTPGMWHEVGFLSDAFEVFKRHGLSIDLVSTSETNVTVSLDPAANSLDPQVIATLLADLSQLGRAQVLGPCTSVSLVGRNIRAILHQAGQGVRAVRRAAHLSAEPGRQRFEFHLRRGREPGRSTGE
jgi:diaminopimelate decarboxylase/aspartate kinase